MGPYRIILTDDHVLFHAAMRKLLHGVGDIEVVGEADDGLALLRLLKRVVPDLVVLDIAMPNLRGIEAIPEIKALHPSVRVLMLTMHRERAYLTKAISAGADGYLLKEDAQEQLFAAIESIRQDKLYVSPKLSDDVIESWVKSTRRHSRPLPECEDMQEPLTLREREILKLSAEGKSSKEAADLLCISHRTVENHRANILSKLNLKGTAELVRYAIANGYLSADPVQESAPAPGDR
jgi:DNA-binding NarL/FixJ family response regulator